MTKPQPRSKERCTRFDQALLAGWVLVISLASGGCQSLLTPHQAPYQRNECDSIGGCAGFTETQWTSLDGCGWEESSLPTQFPTHEYGSSQNHAPYDETILLEQPIRAANHRSPRVPANVPQAIEQASYLAADDQTEKLPSLNAEVLEYAESLSLNNMPTELESDDARHEKQLDEISVEYLQ